MAESLHGSTNGAFEDDACCAGSSGQPREETAGDARVSLSLMGSSIESLQSLSLGSQQLIYDLVNPPPDEATCPVCLDLAIKPFLVECCGQHFCQRCLADVRAKGNVCPLCRENAPKAVHNKHFERNVINSQQVRCSEKASGCQWEGLLGELRRHLTQCQYAEEDCPYKCGNRVQCRLLEEHKAKLCPQRPFDCGYCDYHGAYREVIDQHWSLCKSFPLDCPNNCGTRNILRRELQNHSDHECPLQEVACDFSHAGCKVQVVRQDLAQHMSDAAQQHIALVSRALLQDKEREITQLKQQLREKEQEHKEEMERKDKLLEGILEKMSCLEGLIRGSREETSRVDSCGVPKAVNHTTVLDNYQQKRRVDTCTVPKAVDCTLVLSQYQQKRKNEADWYSPPYYTHFQGYKMCVNVDLSPWYTDLRVYSYLLPGEYDSSLKWPFRGTVVVQLLNQLSGAANHYDYVFDYSQASDSQSQKVTQARKSSCRDPSTPFLTLRALAYNPITKCQYLKNDSLTFRVYLKNL